MSSVFKKIPDSERNINASLYFGNIDPQCTEVLMYELFLQFGPIKNLYMPKDRINKIHQGYGFLEFKNPLDAKYTEDILRGVRLFGKPLKLKKLDIKTQQPSSTQYKQIGTFVDLKSNLLNDKFVDVGAKLFINNLNPLIDEKFLLDTFSKFGTIIKQPEIKRDEEGKSLGYGFLTFGDFEISDLVIEKMNNVILMNSKINISYAFKNDVSSINGKRLRHGDKAERILAENAKQNNVIKKAELSQELEELNHQNDQPQKKKRKLSVNNEDEIPVTKIKLIDKSFEITEDYENENDIPKELEINDSNVKLTCLRDGKLIIKYSSNRSIPLFDLRLSGDEDLKSDIVLLNKCSAKYGLLGDIRFNFKFSNGKITLKLSYQVYYLPSLENVIKIEIKEALLHVISKQDENFNKSNNVQITPQIFYQSICDHTREMPPYEQEFDIPELETKLLPFQKKTVNWMLEKESAKLNHETNRCEQVTYFTEDDLNDTNKILEIINKSWFGWKLVNISDEQVFFNAYTGHIATFEQIKEHMVEYLNDEDKASCPTVLPAKALLSEEMGLGKTVETASVILLNQRPIDEIDRKITLPINEFGDDKTIVAGRTTLVIAPVSILNQWKEEMMSLAPTLSITEYKGINSYSMFDNKPAIIADYLRKFDIVFTTYNVIAKELDYARFSSKLRKTRASKKNTLYEEEIQQVPSSSSGAEEETFEKSYKSMFQLTEIRKPDPANAKKSKEQKETDYEKILQKEIKLAMKHNKLPHCYTRNEYESPLMLIQFWRVVLDEVQMVSSTFSRAFQSAALIPRFHGWGVSGTPIKKDIRDLLSYLKFLKVFPFNTPSGDFAFKILLQNSIDFIKFWSDTAIRHTKALVHDDIKLPPQNRVLLTIPFTAIEQEMYNEQFSQCLNSIGLDKNGNPTSDNYELTSNTLTLMKMWLSRLRQLCCSPQVGRMHLDSKRARRANFRGDGMAFVDSLKTLDQLLDEMLSKSYGDLSDVERKNMDVFAKITDLLEYVYYPDKSKFYLEIGIKQIRDIVYRLEVILNRLIDEYKKDTNVNFEDDDEIGRDKKDEQTENYKEGMIFGFRTKLRLWLLLLHRFYFMYASANFQLHNNEFQELVTKYKVIVDIDECLGSSVKDYEGVPRANHLASLVSSAPETAFEREILSVDLGSYQENETKYYELADDIRAKILAGVVKQLKKAIDTRIVNRGFLFPQDSVAEDSGEELIPKTSRKFFNQIPRINVQDLKDLVSSPKLLAYINKLSKLVVELNSKSENINSEFKSLVDILCESVETVENQDAAVTETVENQNGSVKNKAENQNGSVNNRAENQGVSTDEGAENQDPTNYEQNLEAQQKVEDLLSALDRKILQRKHLITGSLEKTFHPLHPSNSNDFTSLISELSTIEEEIKETQSKTTAIELELIEALSSKIRIIFDNQKFAQSSIAKELNVNCNAVFNARIEYFKQLQQISDSVETTKYPYMDRTKLSSHDIEHRLNHYKRSFELNNSSIDTHIGRFRYLTELVKETKNGGNNEENGPNDVLLCVICRSGITLGSLTKCGHKYCKECLQHWLRNSRTCPVCKTRIEPHTIYNFTRYAPELKAQEVVNENEINHKGGANFNSIYKSLDPTVIQEIGEITLNASVSSKVDMIVKQALYLKKNNPSVQIVIFSQWQDMLYILSMALKTAGVSFIESKGVLPIDNKTISNFKNKFENGSIEMFKNPVNEITCFLLNAKAQSAGINLVNATHIFFCEPLVNTSIELQAISRIHRIGQTKPTTVWMFAIENTVEESIIVTSTNKRLKLMAKTNDTEKNGSSEVVNDEEELNGSILPTTSNEIKLSEADSVILNGGLVDEMLEKKLKTGENVNNNDLWHSFFSSRLPSNDLGL
ncbi:hypothetical protein KGF54_003213 [Candida jiufengensis]|uniref:uncharacterized protein n=1 Tax=Candida jiufengensis TaxID=497108 RepID=UPI002225AD3A|nr:uncharacterized protein KGF54_003213 [Candida jiufengensis]KAI5952347.1 hypothetical protein KGF54_003213 [Candida jiufengensis]